MGGELWPEKKCSQSRLSAAFLSLIFSLHSHKRFQGSVVGKGERNSSFKFLVKLFVLLCKLPHFSLRIGTIQMRLSMCNAYTTKSVLKSYCEGSIVRPLKF